MPLSNSPLTGDRREAGCIATANVPHKALRHSMWIRSMIYTPDTCIKCKEQHNCKGQKLNSSHTRRRSPPAAQIETPHPPPTAATDPVRHERCWMPSCWRAAGKLQHHYCSVHHARDVPHPMQRFARISHYCRGCPLHYRTWSCLAPCSHPQAAPPDNMVPQSPNQ